MKLAAIALTLATVSTGCTKHTTMGGGAVLAIGGGILLGVALSAESPCPPDDPICGVVVTPAASAMNAGVGAVGALGLIAGIALIAAGTQIDREAAPPATVVTPAEPLPRDELALALADRSLPQVKLAIQVRSIARSGNCSAALATGKQLRELDPALHLRVVVEDAAYARCVDPAAPTQSMNEPAAW